MVGHNVYCHGVLSCYAANKTQETYANTCALCACRARSVLLCPKEGAGVDSALDLNVKARVAK